MLTGNPFPRVVGGIVGNVMCLRITFSAFSSLWYKLLSNHRAEILGIILQHAMAYFNSKINFSPVTLIYTWECELYTLEIDTYYSYIVMTNSIFSEFCKIRCIKCARMNKSEFWDTKYILRKKLFHKIAISIVAKYFNIYIHPSSEIVIPMHIYKLI